MTMKQLKLRFSSRTDKGVHARGQVACIRVPISLFAGDQTNRPDGEPGADFLLQMRKGINNWLPVDISIQDVAVAMTNKHLSLKSPPLPFQRRPCFAFDPRQHVKLKQCSYTIRYLRQVKESTAIKGSPVSLLRHAMDPSCLWICPWTFPPEADTELLPSWCQRLTGTHDFSPFVHKDDRYVADTNAQGGDQCPRRILNPKNVMTLELLEWQICSEQPLLHSCILPDLSCGTVAANKTFREGENATQDSAGNHAWNAKIVTARVVAQAQGFRRSMVRNLVAFLVGVARDAIMPPHVASLWPMPVKVISSNDTTEKKTSHENMSGSPLATVQETSHDNCEEYESKVEMLYPTRKFAILQFIDFIAL
jgi:tRNA U38,U39,U40 pseudouridine synthase TruA